MNILKLHKLLLAFGFLIIMINGCGYTTRSMISNEFKTIYIGPFENKIDIASENSENKYRIYRAGMETDVTKAVINKYLFDGNLKPVKEGSADLILQGQLMEFRKDPLRYVDNTEDVEEYRVNIVVNLKLLNAKDNELVWQEDGFTGDTSYFTTGAQAKSEATAIADSIADLARRIVERTVEQW